MGGFGALIGMRAGGECLGTVQRAEYFLKRIQKTGEGEEFFQVSPLLSIINYSSY